MSSTVKTWYTPGLMFKAKRGADGHQEVCRSRKEQLAVDGTVVNVIPELLAEFGVVGEEYSWEKTDDHGNLVDQGVGFDFRGGFFNLDIQAEEKGWDDDELEIVARHMLRMACSCR